ncbi:helix-turn-helix domain-containing protein [Haladaptatus halobius]|uniref:helix-turn-helix domain-containing protein n=1 Tax=Haladaptatus halobius TaxID=2884875 RepID=UPI001D0B23BE|nr:helix-turn-helix domain-containing protein [Haladaptatus halobius]
MVYNWLQRFDEDSIEKAASNASCPGQPPKLDHEERTEVHKVLEGLPESAGYDAEEWNTALVQRLLEEQFDVEYSRTSAFRFLT